MPNATIEECVEVISLAIKPEPTITVSEWADKYRMLSSIASGEYGRWKTDRNPPLRKIMDVLSVNSPYTEIVFDKPTQIGGSEVALNFIGYVMHEVKGPIMAMHPTLDVGREWSSFRLSPMIEDTDVLKPLVLEPRTKDSNNTKLRKRYEGGMITIVGAKNSTGLRQKAVKFRIYDDIDDHNYGTTKEGDTLALGKRRGGAFGQGKDFYISTPTLTGSSNITSKYEDTDQQRYYVPCPRCEYTQTLKWSGIKFIKPINKADSPEVWYECEECSKRIDEHNKTAMIENGEWIAESTCPPYRIGFHINALYSPAGWMWSWTKIVEEFLDATKSNSPGKLQVFFNTLIAETWTEEGHSFEASDIRSRKEVYPAQVPNGVMVLTAAVDVQDNRFECEVKGWGIDEESWSIAYKIIYANPGILSEWGAVKEFLQETFTHEAGFGMKIVAAAIDTGGHHTHMSYKFVKQTGGRVYAIKGSNQPGAPIVGKPSRKNIENINLFPVGTDTAKDTIFSRLELTEPGPGYMHFPEHYTDEYFDGLTSEARYPKYVKGELVGTYYKKLRVRNEPLDLTDYNMAALMILNPNMEALARNIEVQAKEAKEPEGKESKAPVKRRSNFVNRWRS